MCTYTIFPLVCGKWCSNNRVTDMMSNAPLAVAALLSFTSNDLNLTAYYIFTTYSKKKSLRKEAKHVFLII